jgi:hypothetical protein
MSDEEKFYNLSDLKHDPKLAEALGNMVVAWANAESKFMLVLGCILNVADIDMINIAYYRIPTFESRTKFIRALALEWKSTEFDKDAIATAIDKLARLSTTRNGWIHSLWGTSKPKNDTFIWDFRAPPDTPERRRPVKAADVTNHCEAVTRRSEELLALVSPWLERYFALRHGRPYPHRLRKAL